MHIVDYTDRAGCAAQARLSDAIWDMLVEVAESRSQSPAELCGHIDITRTEADFAAGLEGFLYHYYKAKNPGTFTGMSDGDPADSRFEHGLRGVDKDKLFE